MSNQQEPGTWGAGDPYQGDPAHQQPAQGPYPPYGAPQYGTPEPYGGQYPPYYAPGPGSNGLAIAALVVSLVSLTVCCGATGFVGAIMGHIARKQIKQTGEQGDGMALAGIIVGWVGTGLAVAVVAVYVVFFGWLAYESSQYGTTYN